MKFRFFFLIAIFSLLYGALGANLYRLQIEKGAYYVSKVKAMEEINTELQLRRGQIFITDRSGTQIPVALNKDYPVIFVAPSEVSDPKTLSSEIAGPLGLDKAVLEKTIKDNAKSSFRLLIDKATPEQISFVTENRPEGIHIDAKQYRFYPYQKLASQLIGFVGVNKDTSGPVGLYGLEKFYNSELEKGNDVHLTIDRNIQAQAEQILGATMAKYGATGGTALVEDPITGTILALVNVPGFDPNNYGAFPIKDFLNPAVSSIYEPGSVFKPFTMSAGIDLGVITPQTTYTDKGYVTLDGWTIHNAEDKVWGKITMTNVIEHSVNTGAVFVEQQIGRSNFYDYMKKFGFDEKTGIDLTDEVTGSIQKLTDPRTKEVNFATISFGQGVAVTPIQLISAFSSIANGGLLMRPYMNGDTAPYVVRRIMSGETSNEVTKMLISTVDKAFVAAIPQYNVAGKTGTAYIPDFEKGGYSEQMIHTFVGFAPASNPRFVILMKLDKPQVGELAGLTVVPAFRELAQFILNYYNITPDRISNQL